MDERQPISRRQSLGMASNGRNEVPLRKCVPDDSASCRTLGQRIDEGYMPRNKKRNTCAAPPDVDPRVKALVTDLIGQVADKWTMITLEVLAERGELRFTQLAKFVEGVSQKMLTQTLRQMERDGLVERTVHPVVPPRVEYKLTPLGLSLGAAFCGVWVWAEQNLDWSKQPAASSLLRLQ